MILSTRSAMKPSFSPVSSMERGSGTAGAPGRVWDCAPLLRGVVTCAARVLSCIMGWLRCRLSSDFVVRHHPRDMRAVDSHKISGVLQVLAAGVEHLRVGHRDKWLAGVEHVLEALAGPQVNPGGNQVLLGRHHRADAPLVGAYGEDLALVVDARFGHKR